MVSTNYTNRMPHAVSFGSFVDYTTTNNAFKAASTLEVWNFKTKDLIFSTTGANNLSVKVDGSIDGGTAYDILAVTTFSVTNAAAVRKTFSTPYTDLQVSVKPTVADADGILVGKWLGATWST